VEAALSRPARRPGEAGLVGKLALALAAAIVLLAGWTYWRMTSAPDLGPPPQGPAHGDDDLALAAYAVTSLVGLLNPLGSAHATVVLSEQDLTTIARQRATSSFSDPQVRVRDGQVVVSGGTNVIGIGVTAVGRLDLELVRDADGSPDVSASIDEIDAGRLTLPGPLRDAIARELESRVHLDDVLEADSRLRLLRPALECVAVGPSGVVLGFHSPLATPDPGRCAG
jgi:hypothetical protein